MISFTTVYADLYLDDGTINYEEYPGCRDRHAEDMLKYPHSVTLLCSYKYWCENYNYSRDSDRATLSKDYLVQQFLHKNSLSLDKARADTRNTDILGGAWALPLDGSYPKLKVEFNVCSDIKRYTYYELPNSIYHEIEYPIDDWTHPEKILVFEKESYDLVKMIIQRHPPPAIQVSEFNILLNEIHCNEGLELYIRNYNIPVCLKEQTYETLLERGFNLQQVQS